MGKQTLWDPNLPATPIQSQKNLEEEKISCDVQSGRGRVPLTRARAEYRAPRAGGSTLLKLRKSFPIR